MDVNQTTGDMYASGTRMYAPLHSLQSACQEAHELVVAVLSCILPWYFLYCISTAGLDRPVHCPARALRVLSWLS